MKGNPQISKLSSQHLKKSAAAQLLCAAVRQCIMAGAFSPACRSNVLLQNNVGNALNILFISIVARFVSRRIAASLISSLSPAVPAI